MQFSHPHQHTLENLLAMEAEAMGSKLPTAKLLTMADALLSHGHARALPLIMRLQHESNHSQVRRFADMMENSFHRLRGFYTFEALTNRQRELFYRLEGPIFIPRPSSSRLLVVFTTMFNNFHYSNAMLAAMLSRFDCSLLLLRDTTYFNYLRGASGFADDFPGIGRRIQEVARQSGATQIYIAGYSSGGYAALLTALRIPCHGYLGFSHPTDLRDGSMLEPPEFFTAAVRAQIDPEWLVDLKPLLARADPAIPRTLYYGDKAPRDNSWALHVADMPAVSLICLPGIAHNTVEPLFSRGGLLKAFAATLSGKSSPPVPRMSYPDQPRRS